MTGLRVLYVITKSNWGGAQRYVYDLAKGMKEKGAEVAVAYGGTGEANAPKGVLAVNLDEAAIRGIFVKSFMRDISIVREFRALSELLQIFKKEQPHAVHLNSSKAGGTGALAARIAGIKKIVFTSHGLPFDEDRPLLARGVIWLLTWLTFLLSHDVILITKDSYERAKRFPFCGKKLHLIYNGIPEIVLTPREEARTKLLPNGNPTVPWVGTIAELTRNKGIDYLLDAARLLAIRSFQFELCIIGSGEEYEKYKAQIAGYGLTDRVHLLGFVPNAARYLSAFDIFTLTSVKEGQPYVLLEAAQAGCAIVASRIPGIMDMLDDHTGILVTPKNPVAVADALTSLLSDPEKRQTFGTAFKLEAASRFSLSTMLERTAAVYR